MIAVVLFAAATVQQAAADTAPVESLSTSSLPAGWDQAVGSWSLTGSACGSESCVAVGSYEFAPSHSHGLIVPISDGIAGAAVQLPLPPLAQTDATQNDQLSGVSCWSSASCVAIGTYYDTGGDIEGVVIPIVNGVAGTPQEVRAPAAGAPDPAGTDPFMLLQSVSCAASGECVAVGGYSPQSGGEQAVAVTIEDGVAGDGVEVPAPLDTHHPPTSALDSVSCQANGSCVAVGEYLAGSGPDVAMVVPITTGVPGAAKPMTSLPSDADSTQGDDLTQVACPATGTCAAFGYYSDSSSGDQREMVVPITNGVAGAGVEAPAPTDDTGGSPYSIDVTGLACQSTGACLASGSYVTADGREPVAIPITNGVPAAAERITLPGDAERSGQFAELSSVACPVTGTCLAVGDYRNGNSDTVPLTVEFAGGGVGVGAGTAELPDESTAISAFAELNTVACATFSCAGTGSYSNATEAPFVLSAQAPLAIAPTNLPAGTVASAYSQSLTASGAWGVYGDWSLTSGSLPAGLSLDAQTGVISGTPTAAGTTSFTLQLSSTTGVPLQTATESYALTIAAPPPTPTTPTTTVQPTTTQPTSTAAEATSKLTLAGHSATVRKNRFGLKLRCAAAPCHGSLKLRISETITVKRGKKKVRKHVTVVIANASFSFTAGQTKTLTVTLNRAGRRALAKHRLRVTVLDTMAGIKQTLGQLTLKPAPVRHRKK